MHHAAPIAPVAALALLSACRSEPVQVRTWEGYRYGAPPLRIAHGVIETIEPKPEGAGVEAGRVAEPEPGRNAQRILVRLDGGATLTVDDVAAGRLHVGDRVRIVGKSDHRM